MHVRWVAAAALVAVVGTAWAKGGGDEKPAPDGPAPQLLVAVVDAAGKPAPGANVAILHPGDDRPNGDWKWSRLATAVADANGVATFTSSLEPVCLLVWTDATAGLVCNEALRRPPETTKAALGPGARITGRIVGVDGKPVVGTRARVRAPSESEWHHFEAAVASDGTFTLPTLPRALLDQAEAAIDFQAPGVAIDTCLLGPNAGATPLELRFSAPRSIKGRLVGEDGKPVVGGEIHTADWIRGPKSDADDAGAFEFGPLPRDVRRVHIASRSHADFALTVPAGDGVLDVGEVVLPVGAPVEVRVVEKDGRCISRAFVALQTRDGFRVGQAEGAGPPFTFPRVGGDIYTLDVYVHEIQGAVGWRHVRRQGVRAGGEPIEIAVPTGLVVKLIDEAGKPFAATEVRVSCDGPALTRPWTENFQAFHAPPFSEIRFGPMPPSDEMRVTVTVKDHEPVELADVKIDKDGCGSVSVVIGK